MFSYLPVASYGLKFIIQGDFILASDREAVTQDSPWSVELVQCFFHKIKFYQATEDHVITNIKIS